MKLSLFIAVLFLTFTNIAWSETPADLETIKPVLQAKCAACHYEGADKPATANIFPINRITRAHTKEAHEHWNLNRILNANGLMTDRELKDLHHVTVDGEMPPWAYRFFHQESHLTAKEKEDILSWIYSQKPELKSMPT